LTRRGDTRNPERDREIVALIRNGKKSVIAVSREEGLSRTRIYDILAMDDEKSLEKRRARQRAYQKRKYAKNKASKAGDTEQ
jgi:hypothetical protein